VSLFPGHSKTPVAAIVGTMAPSKKPYQDAKVAKKAKNWNLHSFFAIKRKPGCPKKKQGSDNNKKKCGRPPAPKIPDISLPVPKVRRIAVESTIDSSIVAAAKPKVSQTNWGKSENKERLDKAVKAWDARTGYALDSNGEERSLQQFAAAVSIPYNTLKSMLRRTHPSAAQLVHQSGDRPLCQSLTNSLLLM